VNSRRRGPDPDIVARARQAQAGDEQAFADLFQTLHTAVLNYAYQILGDGPSAEDVTQDAFVVAHQRLGMLGPPYDFKSWVFRIAGNLAIDQIRRDRRLVDIEDADVMAEPPTTRRPPERQARRAEQQQLIRRTLDRLPTAYRQALVLREVHDLSYEELARALECSYDSARQLVHRARLRFRDIHGLRLTMAGGPERCQELGDLVSAFHDGELSGEAEAAVRKHIATCAQCRETQEDLRSVALLLAVLPPLIPSAQWAQQALRQVQQSGAPGHGAAKVQARIVEQQHTRAEQPGSPDGSSSGGETPPVGKGGSGGGAAGGHGGGSGEMLFRATRLSGARPGSSGGWIVGFLFGTAALVGVIGLVGLAFRAWSHRSASSPSLETTLVVIGGPVALSEPTEYVPPTPATPLAAPATSTPVFTPTPTATVTLTIGPRSAIAQQNANCRTGPGTIYRNITTLLQGQSAMLEGRNEDSTWWWIPTPGASGHCWVWGGSLSIAGPADSAPVIAAPPTDTPVPGDTEPPVVSISYAPTGQGRPTDRDKISLTATAADAESVAKIEIWLRLSTQPQAALMRTCTETTSCFFAGGPYPSGMAQAFARAWDEAENQGESNAISFVIYESLK
jgi:RNA polymerase sigma-70 factor, ECF subfamily